MSIRSFLMLLVIVLLVELIFFTAGCTTIECEATRAGSKCKGSKMAQTGGYGGFNPRPFHVNDYMEAL